MSDSVFNRYFSYVNIYTTCKSFHGDGTSCKNISICITNTDQTMHTFIEKNLFKLHFGHNTHLCTQIQYQSTENKAMCTWTFLFGEYFYTIKYAAFGLYFLIIWVTRT